MYMLFFFFNDTATTEIYTLSLHDALPIYIVIHAILFHPQTLVLLSRFFWNIVRAFLLNVEYLPLFLNTLPKYDVSRVLWHFCFPYIVFYQDNFGKYFDCFYTLGIHLDSSSNISKPDFVGISNNHSIHHRHNPVF